MLAQHLGSLNIERVLVFHAARGRGHARQIARFFEAPLFPIQRAIERLEVAGVLVGRPVGTPREYEFSPRYAARKELRALVEKALALYPADLQEKLGVTRARPRRKGKPL